MSLAFQHKTQQSSINGEVLLSVPVGSNLATIATRTANPSKGALGYDKGTNELYYGNDTVWTKVSTGVGDGDVNGPAGATDNAIARYDTTTGKLIQNSVVTISDSGAINNITTINGNAIGDVVGPAGATDNAVARYDTTTGKLIQNSVVAISDAGAITGVTTINGFTNTGDVTLTTVGAVPNANAASLAGQQLQLQPASASFPGVVTTSAQSFAGTKDFSTDGIIVSPTVGGLTNLFGGSAPGYYRSAPIAVTWDPLSALYSNPQVGSIICERIGNQVFITVARMIQVPTGGAVLVSDTGVVPTQFRPAQNRLAYALTVNGYVNALPANQMLPPNNVPVGAVILTTDGTLRVGTSQSPNTGPVQDDGTTLQPFGGPNSCGILQQTLVFSAS